MEALGPFLPLARDLGGIAMALAEGTSVDALEVEYRGRIAERDTRLLTVQVLEGRPRGHTEEEVNDVNAPVDRRGARDRGLRDEAARTRATSPSSCAWPSSSGGERDAGGRHDARPAATARTCSRRGARASTSSSSRTSPSSATRTGPGMLGRVGTIFGEPA